LCILAILLVRVVEIDHFTATPPYLQERRENQCLAHKKDSSYKLRFGVKTNKWLVSMSAAAVAAGAMAVSSENIVGVVEREDGVDGYNWTCGTFDAVGGGNFSINDITLNDGGQYYISDNCLQVLDADGYTDEDYYYQEISTGVFQWNDGNGDPADRDFAASEGFLIENLDSIEVTIAKPYSL
jgi:hypothetical protein